MGSPVSAEQKCWARAVEASKQSPTEACGTALLIARFSKIFNAELTRDPKKRRAASDLHGNRARCGIRELVIAAEKHRAACSTPSPLRKCLETIVQVGNKYAPVVDVMVQHQPHITALVWGAIRLLIGVAVAEIETSEEIGDALDVLVRQIGRYQTEAQLFLTSTRVQESISRVYAQILKYLIRATSYSSYSYAVRFGKAGFSPSRTKLKATLCSIERESAVLDREVRTASEEMHAKNREGEARPALSAQSNDNPPDAVFPTVQYSEFAKEEAFRADMRALEERRRKATQLETVLRWLHQPPKQQPKDIPPWQDGTCGWIYGHPVYQKWRQSGYSGCLHIQGPPGCGKSVLTKYLAETANTKPYVLTHFFRDYVDRQSALGKSFALSLLTELFEIEALVEDARFPPVLEDILLLRHSSKSARDCSLKKLLGMLDKLLGLVPTFTLLVDALDECNDIDQDSGHLVRYLLDLGTRPDTRVILFSRNHARFDEILRDSYHVFMDQSTIESDILLFLKAQISAHRKDLQSLEANILDKASTNCEGMFMWAAMMIEYVRKGHSHVARKRRLHKVPPGLFAIYKQLLEDIDTDVTDEEMDLRCNIFLLLIGAHETLAVHEIVAALSLNSETDMVEGDGKSNDPEATILRLCGPLVMVVNGKLQLIHMSVKEFLLQSTRRQRLPTLNKPRGMSLKESNSLLAQKTLDELTQSQYRYWKYPARLLRRHLLTEINVTELEEHIEKESAFYNYSCLHWHDHLTELERPSEVILTLLKNFLTGNELVTWSEVLFDLKEQSGLGAQIEVRATLQIWYNEKLLPEFRLQVPISDYFVASHESLNEELAKVAEDKILTYLPLHRLGDYYNVGGENLEEWQKGYEYKKTVAEGFGDLLGQRSPVTLRARTSLYQEYFWQMRMDEAEKGLLDVSSIQLEVFGKRVADYFNTIYLLGVAQFHLNKFVESRLTLEESAEGLRGLLGQKNAKAFMAELFNGYALEAQGKLNQANCLYEHIWTQWTQITSEEHPLSLMVLTARGSIYRKMRQFPDARKALESSWVARKRLFSAENNVSADSGIQLAIFYRDARQSANAKQLLDEVSRSSIFPGDFERGCQLIHMRALLAFDDGEYESPKLSLLHLLDQATGSYRDRNNRELLWVRITLADVMRSHGECDVALMLFMELVEPVEDSDSTPGSPPPLDDEPEPPSQLRIAEQALRYVKSADQQAAANILEQNKLRWVRQRDFWILQGGPIADTACMDGPRILSQT